MPSANGKKPGPGRPTRPKGSNAACQTKKRPAASSATAIATSPARAETGRPQAPCSAAFGRVVLSHHAAAPQRDRLAASLYFLMPISFITAASRASSSAIILPKASAGW